MTTSIFGSVVHRVEDPRFLTGDARYVDDLCPEGAMRAVFVRSMMAHARLLGIDASQALALPGVAAVLVAADLDLMPQPPSGEVLGPFERPVLASEVVRFVGEPVALVLAETAALAEDAAELVALDLDPSNAVIDPEAALGPDAPVLFPEAGTNVAAVFEEAWDEDVLADAEVIARLRVRMPRLAPVPMESNALLAVPGEDPLLTLWVSTQIPFDVRNDVAEWLGLNRADVRVVATDVGGGFGAKLQVSPEYLAVAAAALRLRRPVAWQESRSESMLALTHGRAQVHDVQIGARRDGTLVGLRVDILADQGAYPIAAYLAPTTRTMLPGVYAIPRVASRGRCVVTNATPVAPYRGAGRPEATLSIERAMDALAFELGLDPIELRRRNLIPPEAFPYVTATGETYDTGEYERAMDEALRLAGVRELRLEQVERRARGDRLALGIGMSVYVEVTGATRKELGSVEVETDGSVTVRVGTSSQGQGHETAFAQLASGILAVPIGSVRVIHSDTAAVPRGEGTYGSRSLQIAGSSVFEAAETVVEKARRLAAHLLEAAPEDVTLLPDGRLGVTGAPHASLQWRELAVVAADPPKGFEPGLFAETRRYQREHTFPFGAHVAVVEVDVETGDVRLIRHVAVDDCGRVLNAMLVEGQVHGGLAQGIAQALFEEVVYDEGGTPLTTNLATYLIPSATELPAFLTARTETPTPLNPLGAKGIGESATIGSTPAVVNAAVDALSHLGISHLDPPLSPERVWRAMIAASSG
ncbi:MAG TPA: xanthine dehydrogenase family protein molybdopterin-binding subunit [Actinomycetota bacterium]|nr:xanthine dehydrogenase family protein molybdopterin-binding subunit [Actinomycetota bacterium]